MFYLWLKVVCDCVLVFDVFVLCLYVLDWVGGLCDVWLVFDEVGVYV